MPTLEGGIAFASTYFCDLVGISHEQVDRMSWFDFVFPEDMDSAHTLFDVTTLLRGDPLRLRLRRLNGTEVWADIQPGPLKEHDGQIYAVTATVTAAKGNR